MKITDVRVSPPIGPDVDLAIDLHARYNVADALRIAYELEPFNLMWLEDPIPPGNHEAMAKVTAKARVPICTGEMLRGREQFRDLLVGQAADVIQPDTPRASGMRDLKKIADLADLYHVSVAPHNMTSPIGTIAAVHACAACPNFLALEFHCQVIGWWNDVAVSSADGSGADGSGADGCGQGRRPIGQGRRPIGHGRRPIGHGRRPTAGPLIQRGYIQVPEAPGLGVRPDEAVLRQHCQGPLWS